jgi:hypothetical protein
VNVGAALNLAGHTRSVPPSDALETNDDAGRAAHAFGAIPGTLVATLDFWDDPVDVYSVHLNKGDQLFARLGLDSSVANSLLLWRPGTTSVNGAATQVRSDRAARSITVAGQKRLSYIAPATGVYYLEVSAVGKSRAADQYALSVARGKPPG